ncbi:MAG: glycosyltransferase family 39 protein [Actinomycetota bacterium]|nr:glycosyltransferase family 39 protein [Actinomycetota bacterium]
MHDRRGKKRGGSRLFAVYLGALAAIGIVTVGQIGITWDEPNYFTSSYSYLSWFGHVFENPDDWWASIDRYWEQSHEAPPLFKLWAGIFAGAGALLLGTENLGALGDAYRLGSYTLFLLAVYAAYRFMRREFGPAAAWGAALSLPLVPALFGFARLGQLDGAAASMYLLAAIFLFGMLVRGGRRRTVFAGVLLGLAFATKLTVFPLVLAALAWALVYRRERAVFARLFVSFGIGAVVFFAVWPWLWRDPVGRMWEFLTWAGGLQEERLAFYLGQWWAGAPWHYPLVALVALVPLAVAAAGLVGAVRLFADSGPAAGWVLINLALVVAVAGSGLVPVYGGPRQFLAAFPLWALCAGAGVGWLARALRPRPAVVLAVYAAFSLPGILWTGTANSLEYYGEAVGLIPGARALGFETTYLADTYKPAVRYVNEAAPRGATVYVQAGTYAVAETYRRIGELREDLRPAYLSPIAPEKYIHDPEPREDSYFLFLPRQSIYTDQMLALEEREPLYAYEKGGVPLVKVYSGEVVAETLDIEGEPEARNPGLPNALISFGGVLAALALLWRKQYQDKER